MGGHYESCYESDEKERRNELKIKRRKKLDKKLKGKNCTMCVSYNEVWTGILLDCICTDKRNEDNLEVSDSFVCDVFEEREIHETNNNFREVVVVTSEYSKIKKRSII